MNAARSRRVTVRRLRGSCAAPSERPKGMMSPDWPKALEAPSFMRSQEAQGACVVGSFPMGASHDRDMDLAGNVAEWCADWHQLYTPGAKADPLETRESHSRVIRGGSWGYYGHSQRAADREFNSEKYPGYIYVGFGTALPEESWRKTQGM